MDEVGISWEELNTYSDKQLKDLAEYYGLPVLENKRYLIYSIFEKSRTFYAHVEQEETQFLGTPTPAPTPKYSVRLQRIIDSQKKAEELKNAVS